MAERHHALRLRLRIAPRQEPLPQALLGKSLRAFFPHRFLNLFPFTKVGFDLGTMPKIKANDRENVGQRDRRKLIYDTLRRLALLKSDDDRIQRDSRAANADNTTLAQSQRRSFGFNNERHLIPLRNKTAMRGSLTTHFILASVGICGKANAACLFPSNRPWYTYFERFEVCGGHFHGNGRVKCRASCKPGACRASSSAVCGRSIDPPRI